LFSSFFTPTFYADMLGINTYVITNMLKSFLLNPANIGYFSKMGLYNRPFIPGNLPVIINTNME